MSVDGIRHRARLGHAAFYHVDIGEAEGECRRVAQHQVGDRGFHEVVGAQRARILAETVEGEHATGSIDAGSDCDVSAVYYAVIVWRPGKGLRL